MPQNILAPPVLEDSLAPIETLRRVEVFLNALAALPKKSWRTRFDPRGIRVEGPGLTRAARLYEILEVPAAGQSVVHVVGTSGKGSTALMIAQALLASGRRTAAFFSPHLTSIIERFWIRGRFAEAGLIGRCAKELADAAAQMAGEPEFGPPSFFESTLALLLLMAREEECEYLVLEAGLGGAFDATNAVGPAVLDVVTSIGLDHTDLLGDSVAQIARDKAGIITERGRVISQIVSPDARAEIERVALERGAGLFPPPRVENLDLSSDGAFFDLAFDDGVKWEGFTTPMPGAHQAENASLAAGAGRLLGLDDREVRWGVASARLPCRMELAQTAPRVLLDGAHNRDKAQALIAGVSGWTFERLIFVLGAVNDKDFAGMAGVLASAGNKFFVTLPPASAPRPGLAPEVFARALEEAGACGVETRVDAWRALHEALDEAGENDLLIITGSMFLAGELRRRWVSEERIVESGSAFPPEALP
ncbi:MAG: Mur ligase family protein [Nitrospinae bacterium]|nr:Mur ligase family protein [Nitrospinota bacterium]